MFTDFLITSTLPNWVTSSFPVIQTILLIVIALSALTIILAILIQPSSPDKGSNAITGVTDSYYMKHKGSTKEGRLNKLIIICAVAIFVCTILYLISTGIYNGLQRS